MNVLGIETSCDETAVAVVESGRVIRSSVIASQMLEHARFGGVVPEVASRRHVENINTVIRAALSDAGVTLADIGLIAVTNRPGLLGALLVGVSAAKALAMVANIPLVGVHHIEAHLYANFLTHVEADFPAVALVVSGGHTDLFHLRGHGDYRLLGRTRDDAAGEAFDKCARLMGLPYPGGPAIQEAAKAGNPGAVKLPRAYLPGTDEFSFSGLKTAVRNALTGSTGKSADADPSFVAPKIADLAAGFQEAVVDVLVRKTVAAARETDVSRVFLAGGVAANERLREAMGDACDKAGLRLFYPPPVLCTDNGAMIAATGYYHYQAGRGTDDLSLTALPSEPLAAL
ncbi:MAG: tRNA (adenosine(37)-N6)-threonylcarbamoyltransferase complex transferase subunit TsaD [Armatimonadetes bacterium]|nr:tRNA (adenosine(37)-N6)-threonylcarbamoyltransferase complex transferase subunit TsaD [Armatimonadota bacterium]